MPNLANLPVADLQAGTANWSGQGYIEGLKMVWNSATSLSVTSGAAFIPSLSKCLQSPSAITKSGLSLAASTWYHVYLYLNAGTPDIEIVTTAPAAPYNGTARAKTGDTSRRYVGSILTDTSGGIFSIKQTGNKILYRSSNGGIAPFRILNNGVATVLTTVNASSAMPITSTNLIGFAQNLSSNGFVAINAPGDALVNFYVGPNKTYVVDLYTDELQAIQYKFDVAPSGGGAYLDVLGYTYER